MNPHFLFFGSLLLLLSACNPYQKDTSSINQRKRVDAYRKVRQEVIAVEGRWQEYKRTISEKGMAPQSLNFSDTLKVMFDGNDNTKFYDAQGRITGGKFIREKNAYRLGNGISYDGFSVNKGEMVLRNGKMVSYLKLVDRFYIARPVKEKSVKEEQEIEALNAEFLIGKWNVYKKEYLKEKQPVVYLDALEIGTAIDAQSYYLRSFVSENTKLKQSQGILYVKEKYLTTETKDGIRNYKILRASGNELILQDGELRYFLKNFAKS